jgi:hypothetical protein
VMTSRTSCIPVMKSPTEKPNPADISMDGALTCVERGKCWC